MSGRVLDEVGVWPEPAQSQQSACGRSRGGRRGQVRASTVSAKRWLSGRGGVGFLVCLCFCRGAGQRRVPEGSDLT